MSEKVFNTILIILSGPEPHLRLKRESVESSIKGMSGLGEVDPGFVEIKPNKVLVKSNSNEEGKENPYLKVSTILY